MLHSVHYLLNEQSWTGHNCLKSKATLKRYNNIINVVGWSQISNVVIIYLQVFPKYLLNYLNVQGPKKIRLSKLSWAYLFALFEHSSLIVSNLQRNLSFSLKVIAL